jgi:ribosome modulation factor
MIVDFTKHSPEWVRGYEDYEHGVSENDCPYDNEYHLESWYEGWTWARDKYLGEKI